MLIPVITKRINESKLNANSVQPQIKLSSNSILSRIKLSLTSDQAKFNINCSSAQYQFKLSSRSAQFQISLNSSSAPAEIAQSIDSPATRRTAPLAAHWGHTDCGGLSSSGRPRPRLRPSFSALCAQTKAAGCCWRADECACRSLVPEKEMGQWFTFEIVLCFVCSDSQTNEFDTSCYYLRILQ